MIITPIVRPTNSKKKERGKGEDIRKIETMVKMPLLCSLFKIIAHFIPNVRTFCRK